MLLSGEGVPKEEEGDRGSDGMTMGSVGVPSSKIARKLSSSSSPE